MPAPPTKPIMENLNQLLSSVRTCTLCQAQLPLGPRPVLQLAPSAKILIAGQAPGARVHASGIPFLDASGQRLRQWLGIDDATFYDATQVAILPMGMCYPGTGPSGDLPPRPECAATWRARLLQQLPQLQLTLVIGQYAQAWHLPGSTPSATPSVTETVRNWRAHWPNVLPLPHPSPRNNRWLRDNPWFAAEIVPLLQARVAQLLRP